MGCNMFFELQDWEKEAEQFLHVKGFSSVLILECLFKLQDEVNEAEYIFI